MLIQGWAISLETGPDPSDIFFKRAKGNKKNEYNCCNKMIIIIIMKNLNLNLITLQLQTSGLHRYFAKIDKTVTIVSAKGKAEKTN